MSTDAMEKPMLITKVSVSNVGGVKEAYFQIDDTGNLVSVGGENGAGKSSFLYAVMALTGRVPKDLAKPVRDGADEAEVIGEISDGDETYIVTRKWFTTMGGEEKSDFSVVLSGHVGKLSSPSTIIEGLTGKYFADPMAILDADPRDRRKLAAKALGVDFDQFDREKRVKLDAAKDAKRICTSLETVYQQKPHYKDAPAELTDAAEISARLQDAYRANSEFDTAERNWLSCNSAVDACDAEVSRLQALIREQIERKEIALKNGEEWAAKAKAPRVDVESIEKEMASVEEVNTQVRANLERKAAQDQFMSADKDRAQAEQELMALETAFRNQLASSKFPVPGVGFGDDDLTVFDRPWNAASHAEQLIVATHLSVATAGRLRPIFIHEGGALDKKSWAIIASEAVKLGSQVFLAAAANLEKDGFDRQCTLYFDKGDQVDKQGKKAKKS